MIRGATVEDLDDLMRLTQVCAKHMISMQIFQWNEHYPNRQAFETDLKRNELYVLEFNDTIYGCITVSTLKDEEYQPVSWLSELENNIYVHRLAVHPNHQGKGYAQELMNFAEKYARKHAYISIRLDTFSQNKRNQQFYEKRGYKRLENIYFPKQSEHPFYCYELIL